MNRNKGEKREESSHQEEEVVPSRTAERTQRTNSDIFLIFTILLLGGILSIILIFEILYYSFEFPMNMKRTARA